MDHEKLLKRYNVLNFEKDLIHYNTFDHVIWFDGGTTCNIPSKGFGFGYGSYKIGDNEIIRLKFEEGHSNNSAELKTLLHAFRAVNEKDHDPWKTCLVIGDSTIALKWINWRGPIKTGIELFKEQIKLLKLETHFFGEIIPCWWPRNNSVKMFGH